MKTGMSRILEDKDNFGSLINLPRSGFSERIEKPQRINLWAEQNTLPQTFWLCLNYSTSTKREEGPMQVCS